MNQEERIDQYIRGKLDTEDQAAFEEEMQQDEALKKRVKAQKEVAEGIKDVFRAEMLTHFDELEQEIAQEDQQPKGNIRRLLIGGLAIAASLLLVVWVWFGQATADPETLFAQHYTTYPNYVSNVERNEPKLVDLYEQSFQQYEQGQYDAAAQGFEQILGTKPNDEVVHFYLGLTYLELNDAQKAIKNLAKVQATDNRYTVPAAWYTALANLKIGKLNVAKATLEDLAKQEGAYQAKAQELLNAL